MGRSHGEREIFVCQCGNEIVCEEPGCNELAVVDDTFGSSLCDYHTDEAYKQAEADMEVERRLENRAMNEDIDRDVHETRGVWN